MDGINRILIPIDGSDVSRWAIARAALILDRPGVEVTLLTVIEAAGDRASSPAFQADPRHQPIREALEAARHELARGGIFARARLHFGDPAEMILLEASLSGADLIAMSTHGRTGLGRILAGSVAQRVVRGSTVPVLLFRPFLRPDDTISPVERFDPVRFERILVLLDGSESAEKILPAVRSMARSFDSRLLLMTAVPGGEAEKDSRRLAEEYLEKKARLMEAEGMETSFEVRTGAPAEEALACIQERAIDAIAMTTHGRTGTSRALYGSVAEKLASHAEVPLLVVANRAVTRRVPIAAAPFSVERKE